MKAINLMVITLLLSSLTVLGQSDRQNLEKYWYMRKQLTERFLRVGDKPGYNIPAGIIGSGPIWHDSPLYPVERRVKWGDGTIELGWYIAVLATEYKVIRNNNLDGSETLRELFLAIETIERLDIVAEKVWSHYHVSDVPLKPNGHSDPDNWEFVQNNLEEVPYNQYFDIWEPTDFSTTKNGFIIRDDVHYSILDDFDFPYTSMESSMSRPKNAQYSYAAPNGYLTNNYLSNSPPANEMSQDQLFSLLMGLVFAKEYCSNVTYNGTNVGDYASTVALRMLNYYNLAWIIKNPERNAEVLIGGNSSWFSSSLTRLKNYFTDGSKSYNPVQAPIYYNPCGGNSVNYALSAIIMSISNSTTPLILNDYVDGDIGWEMYTLLNNTLYGHSNNYYPLADVKEDLNLCPCRGPYLENILWTPDNMYTTNGQWAKIYPDGIPERWNKGNRFRTADCESVNNNYITPEATAGGTERWFAQQYNGLDYMLLYNLYRINYDGQDLYRYMDMRDAIASGTLPMGSQGTVSNVMYYNSFGYMKSDLKLLAATKGNAGGAELYARKSIRLIPGFYAQGGSKMLAKIHPDDVYECSSGTFKSLPVSKPERNASPEHATMSTSIDYTSDESVDEEVATVSLFPNPSSDYVQIAGVQCVRNIVIINSMGAVVRDINNQAVRIDLNGLSAGSYVVKITDCDAKEHFTKLLIVQ